MSATAEVMRPLRGRVLCVCFRACHAGLLHVLSLLQGLGCTASSRLGELSRAFTASPLRRLVSPSRAAPKHTQRGNYVRIARLAEPRSGEAEQPRVEAAKRPEPWVWNTLRLSPEGATQKPRAAHLPLRIIEAGPVEPRTDASSRRLPCRNPVL